jgi:SAM-dependent methyltransferase
MNPSFGHAAEAEGEFQMAIDRGTARLLLSEHAKRPFRGSILELGRQTILLNESQLRAWAKQAGANLRFDLGKAQAHDQSQPELVNGQFDDNRFFHSLGFDQVTSCDVSPYENATLIADLNQPVPREWHDQFDVIFNGGTMEHVFNAPLVLANIHAMLKVGGRAIHIAPSSNMLDHGFYSFSPTFFADYYLANRYQLLKLNLFQCTSWTGNWDIYDCLAGGIDHRLGRVCTSKMSGLFCVAEKTPDSVDQILPSQGCFSKLSAYPHADRSEKETDGSNDGMRVRHPNLAELFYRIRALAWSRYPNLAELFYQIRALAWRTIPGRRSAMPPFLGRF